MDPRLPYCFMCAGRSYTEWLKPCQHCMMQRHALWSLDLMAMAAMNNHPLSERRTVQICSLLDGNVEQVRAWLEQGQKEQLAIYMTALVFEKLQPQ